MLGRLTARQQEMFDIIVAFISTNGYPPTLRDLGERMGITSTNGVNDHLKALERKGWVTRAGLKSRTIRPTKTATGGKCLFCGHTPPPPSEPTHSG